MKLNHRTLYGFHFRTHTSDHSAIEDIAEAIELTLQGRLILHEQDYLILPNNIYEGYRDYMLFAKAIGSTPLFTFTSKDLPNEFVGTYYDSNGRLYE